MSLLGHVRQEFGIMNSGNSRGRWQKWTAIVGERIGLGLERFLLGRSAGHE
jgi:hypothetical protein